MFMAETIINRRNQMALRTFSEPGISMLSSGVVAFALQSAVAVRLIETSPAALASRLLLRWVPTQLQLSFLCARAVRSWAAFLSYQHRDASV